MVVAMTDMDKLPKMCNDCRKIAVANTEGQFYCTETFRVLDSLTGRPGWCPLVEVEHDCQRKEKDTGWIPVTYHAATDKEREECHEPDLAYVLDCEMPDDNQEILVTTDGGNVYDDIMYICDDGYELDSGRDVRDIQAWMPMPDPYKAGMERQ